MSNITNNFKNKARRGLGMIHGRKAAGDNIPVNVSADEAILPKKTVRALGGAKGVAHLIKQTTGKMPTGIRSGSHHQVGGVPIKQIPPVAELAAGLAETADARMADKVARQQSATLGTNRMAEVQAARFQEGPNMQNAIANAKPQSITPQLLSNMNNPAGADPSRFGARQTAPETTWNKPIPVADIEAGAAKLADAEVARGVRPVAPLQVPPTKPNFVMVGNTPAAAPAAPAIPAAATGSAATLEAYGNDPKTARTATANTAVGRKLYGNAPPAATTTASAPAAQTPRMAPIAPEMVAPAPVEAVAPVRTGIRGMIDSGMKVAGEAAAAVKNKIPGMGAAAAEAVPAAPAAPPAASFSAGQRVGQMYRNLPAKPASPFLSALGVAPEALLNERKNAFLNDPNTPFADRARMTAKDVLRYGGSAVGMVLGAPIGQAAIPVPFVGAGVGGVAGAVIGNELGDAAGNAIFGDPMKDYEGEGWNLGDKPVQPQAGAQPAAAAPQAGPQVVGLPKPAETYPMSTPGNIQPTAPAAPARPALDPNQMLNNPNYAIPSGTGSIRSSNGKAMLIDSRPSPEQQAAAAKAQAGPDMNTPAGVLQQAQKLLMSRNTGDRVVGAKLMRHAYPQLVAAESSRYGHDKSFESARLTAEAQRGVMGLEQSRKEDENARQAKDAYRKSLEGQFMKSGKDGKQEVDQTGLGEFMRLAESTAAKRLAEAKTPEEAARWQNRVNGKSRSVAELDEADKSELLKNFRMRARHAEGAGNMFWDNDKADSDDLHDWTPTESNGTVEFPRLTARRSDKKKVGGATKNYEYAEGPVGYFDWQHGKTPTNEYLSGKK